ncbi:AEC family transporter [Cellvibrio japonicus]|uniref:Auxin Efflux Carrier superfamily n=1 Tax=Cellvibrio japonicus (strain Ueda107) TaxID=498211 RepID=B3PIH1_CELJU|nr:AEC family transporter [Cellvibrio japonicus]ACE84947.1 Auxin Efflux Carrier superfamily [Cellvibrio japonicus Ueda107]QEI12572.1 AEC family transporter [Cellvibrio japonicus]QEI16146.1 AEC family transporter [Cellvibrio japonicus]QEI19724.1 AEC family transporter [Cellvibrio japonicus]
MSNLVLIILCLLLGILFQRLKAFPPNASLSLNAYVIYVALPALILNEIPKLRLDHHAVLPVVAAWLVMGFCALITYLTARWRAWSSEVTGAMLLVVTLGNSGFLGIPLIEAHLGAEAIPYAILYDQFGTFIALNTFGILVAGYYANTSSHWLDLCKNILRFPPFIALIFAFLLRGMGYPDWLLDVLPRISSTLVPVVMVAVGLQWQLRLESDHLEPLGIGLVYILVLAPAFALGVCLLLGIRGLAAQVVVLEAAMPAMISAGVLAISHNLAPRLASSLVGYSLMLALVSVWLWRFVVV